MQEFNTLICWLLKGQTRLLGFQFSKSKDRSKKSPKHWILKSLPSTDQHSWSGTSQDFPKPHSVSLLQVSSPHKFSNDFNPKLSGSYKVSSQTLAEVMVKNADASLEKPKFERPEILENSDIKSFK
jgi:hypothetical protein